MSECEWVHVGDVVIESGRLALVDPVLADDLFKVRDDGTSDIVVGAPGLMVSTGLGDGVYPVEAHYEELEGWGRRITAVQVWFLEHEQEDD